jgi:hypothetical protein
LPLSTTAVTEVTTAYAKQRSLSPRSNSDCWLTMTCSGSRFPTPGLRGFLRSKESLCCVARSWTRSPTGGEFWETALPWSVAKCRRLLSRRSHANPPRAPPTSYRRGKNQVTARGSRSGPTYNRSLCVRHIDDLRIGRTLAPCDPFGIPSTSHWTGAAIIVQESPRTRTCIVTRSRTSPRPMPDLLTPSQGKSSCFVVARQGGC